MYTIKGTGIKLLATARGDDHSLFGFNFLPKTGITYTKNQSTWRLTYGEGYSTPTLINTYVKIPGAIATTLGNSDGFTLSDGSKVAPIEPETLKTLEVGFKSILDKRKLFLDIDAYYNWAENLISPIINISQQAGRLLHTGGIDPSRILHQVGASIFTYINYGKVNTYGVDVGLNYYFTEKYSITLNYSFFDYTVDRTDSLITM